MADSPSDWGDVAVDEPPSTNEFGDTPATETPDRFDSTISAAPDRTFSTRVRDKLRSFRESLSPLIGATQDGITKARSAWNYPDNKSDEQFLEDHPMEKLQVQGFFPSILDSASHPLVSLPVQTVEEMKAQGMPDGVAKTYVGTKRGVANVLNFFTSPLGVATLGTGSLPRVAQKTIAAAFAVQMGRQTPQIAQQLGDAVGRGDTEKAAEMAVNGAANTFFTAMGAAHALAPEAKVPPAVTGNPVTETSTPAPKEAGTVLEQPVNEFGDVPATDTEPAETATTAPSETLAQPQPTPNEFGDLPAVEATELTAGDAAVKSNTGAGVESGTITGRDEGTASEMPAEREERPDPLPALNEFGDAPASETPSLERPAGNSVDDAAEAAARQTSTAGPTDTMPQAGEESKPVQTHGTSLSADILDKLDNLKADTDGKLFDGVMGIPVAAWNGSIDAVKLAIRGGRSLQQAVDRGVDYLRSNHPDVKFDEAQYRAMMSRDLVKAINEPSAMNDLRQVIARTANPNQSVLERLRFAQKLSDGLVDAKDAWKRRLNSIKAGSQALWSNLTTLPKFGDFEKALGNWTGADQTTARDIQLFVKELKQKVKDPLRREAITNFIQADGDMTLLQQRAQASKGQVQRGYEMALRLTPEEQTMAHHIRDYLDEKLQQGIAGDLLQQGVENYVTQVWKRENPITQALQASLSASKLPVDFSFARKRMFDSYFDGEQAGHVPASKDISHLMAVYDQSFNRAMSARGFVKQLTEGTASDGRPLVAKFGSGEIVPGTPAKPSDAIMIKPTTRPLNTADYRVIDHPAMRGWKWLGTDTNGADILLRGQLAVHPEAYQHLKNVLSTSALRRNPILKAVLNAQSWAKQTTFSLSPFHQVQEGTHALGHRVNPFKTTELNFRDPAQRELINHGLQVAAYDAQQHFQDGMAGGGPIVGKIPVVGALQNAYTEWLFQEHIPGLKMTMALDAMERNVARYKNELASGKITRDQVAALTARQANAAFGDLNYKFQKYGSNPTFRDTLRLFLIAPDFLEARARFVGQALKPYGREQLTALGLIAATTYITSRVLNQLLDGDPHWDKPFSVVSNKRIYGMRTVPSDIEEMLMDFRRFSSNRLSPLVGRGLIEFFTGRDYRGAPVDGQQQLKDLLASYVPMSVRMKDDESLWQKALSAAGLRNKPYTATMQIRDLAADFNKQRAGGEMPAVSIVSDSIYRPLRLALEQGDRAEILNQYLALLQHRKGSQIQATFEKMATAPFTGNMKSEREFRATLPADKKWLYDEAKREQQQILTTYKSTLGFRQK